VVFAAQALQPHGSNQSPGIPASPTPVPASELVADMAPPVLDAPAGITRGNAISISGHLGAELPASGQYKVRIYVNDEERSEVKLGRHDATFAVAGVPLDEGENTVSATVVGAGDETAQSLPVTVVRDGTAPRIDVTSPAAGSTVYGETMLLNGTTEAGAEVKVVDRTNGAQAATTAGSLGAFSLLVPLRMGGNALELSAVDEAGNSSQKTMSVSRAESQAAVALTLSRDSFDVATLPQAISMVAQVTGPNGMPLDGADITFSISPPGQTTVTHTTTTTDTGSASWSNYPLTRDGARNGHGLVTVLVTLPGGQTLAETADFTFR
jgi:hypothetical protein